MAIAVNRSKNYDFHLDELGIANVCTRVGASSGLPF
jgi:hypothetical protein